MSKEPKLTPMELKARAEREAAKKNPQPPNQQTTTPDPQVQATALPTPKIGPTVQIGDLDPNAQKDIMSSLKAMQEAAQAAVQPATTSSPILPTSATTAPVEPVKSEVHEHKHNEICPNCGFRVELDPIEVTDQDKRDFMRAMYMGTEFEKEYKLFEGSDMHLKLTLRSRKAAVEDMIGLQLRQEIADRRLILVDPATAMSNYLYRQNRLRLAASIARLEGGSMQISIPPMESEQAEQLYKPVKNKDVIVDYPVSVADTMAYRNWPAPLYGAVYRAFVQFEELTRRLLENASRPDFWKGTAGQA